MRSLRLTWKSASKRPLTVEAFQTPEMVDIPTLEGTMTANPGDWIIKGVKGELYPCKPDIFERTYTLQVLREIHLFVCRNCKYKWMNDQSEEEWCPACGAKVTGKPYGPEVEHGA